MTDAPTHQPPRPGPRITARIRLCAGVRGKSIAQELAKDGVEAAEAETIVREELNSIRQKDGWFVFGGLVLALIGLVATVVSCSEATRHTDGYHVCYVWWPPMLFGAVLVVVGIARLGKHKW